MEHNFKQQVEAKKENLNKLLTLVKEIQKDFDDEDKPENKPTGSVPTTKKPKDKGNNIGSDPVPES